LNLAERVVSALLTAGVREAVVCPGGRNAELIAALKQSSISLYWHFEERSAAFFALGRARSTNTPVAVVTTSGTAAGELLPAVMEASYSGAPLIAVTADRPSRFRGTGAPQAAVQPNLFKKYADCIDLEGDKEFSFEMGQRPIQINVCLEDPRRPKSNRKPAPPHLNLASFLHKVKQPLVVVGTLAPSDRPAAARFLRQLGAPVYAEATSGLRSAPELSHLQLRNADRIFQLAEFDGVIRIGGVPTHRLWRDLEDSHAHLPVFSIIQLPFSGLARPSTTGFFEFPEVPAPREPRPNLMEANARRWNDLRDLLNQEPLSEPGIVHRLSQTIADGAHVYLGNSLPIREWDLAADPSRNVEVTASRGLNGIDGQVSTFLGECRTGVENWAILGDLTTLYDLPGPWIFGQLPPDLTATIVILNNSGGRIFERMFPDPSFLNAHDRSFEHWAAMWSMPYQLCADPAEIERGTGLRIVEMRPDPTATTRFWTQYEALAL